MPYSCCFTGHRDIPQEDYEKINCLLNKHIEKMIEAGCQMFHTGGALGFDTMAALAVLKAKEKYPHITLNLYLPYPGQRDRWSEQDKKQYEYIKTKAGKITYASAKYTKFCMLSRNRALVDNSEYCIAYCTQLTGGSAYTMAYARQKEIDFINIAAEI